MTLRFLEETWKIEEESINEMKQVLQGGLLFPKIYQQLQDHSANFQKVTKLICDKFFKFCTTFFEMMSLKLSTHIVYGTIIFG